MAARRNGHLHSGELPFSGTKDGAWVPAFWDVLRIVLQLVQGKALVDIVGSDEAARVEALLAQRISAMEHAVQARVAECGRTFEEQYPPSPRLGS